MEGKKILSLDDHVVREGMFCLYVPSLEREEGGSDFRLTLAQPSRVPAAEIMWLARATGVYTFPVLFEDQSS